MKYDIYFTKAKEAGIEEMEISVSSQYSLSFGYFRGELESYSTSKLTTLSARGTINGKAGYANTEKLDASAPDYIVNTIIANAKINTSDDEVIIFRGSEKYTKKNVYDKSLYDMDIAAKMNLVHDIEQKIRNADPHVKDCEVGYEEGVDESILMNSYGLSLKSKTNSCAIFAQVVALGEDGNSKVAFKIYNESSLNKLNVDEFVADAVESAVSQLNGGPAASGKYRCVFNPSTVAALTRFFLTHADAGEVQKNTSLFKGKVGQKVASRKFTVEERPLDKTPSFRYFDDEGVATFNKKIIDKGVLTTYLYNLATAKKDGVNSTGNGYRGAGKVGTAMRNLVIRPGRKTEEELFEEVGEGIYITDLEGMHAGLNPHSGNFSLQAKGFLIENGKKGKPVCLFTTAGNLFEIFNSVVDVANNSEKTRGVSAPSIYVKSISISGK